MRNYELTIVLPGEATAAKKKAAKKKAAKKKAAKKRTTTKSRKGARKPATSSAMKKLWTKVRAAGFSTLKEYKESQEGTKAGQ